MSLKPLLLFTLCMLLSLPSAAETFKQEIVVTPGVKETVVVQTKVPVSFNAQFVNPDYLEVKKCGNCLHIETVIHGSKNEAASTFGVGFMSVPPENGKITIDVFHDFDSSKTIEVTADPLTHSLPIL